MPSRDSSASSAYWHRPRVVQSTWTEEERACSSCGNEHHALLDMTDGRTLCVPCERKEAEADAAR